MSIGGSRVSIPQGGLAEAAQELRVTVRSFLEAKAPVRRTLELMEGRDGHDRAVWAQMCDQLALPALGIPEAYGGQDFGFREVCVVLEEMGRVLYMGPFFATSVLATEALLLAGDEEANAAYLSKIASGESTGTLAVFEPGQGWRADHPETVASDDDGRWSIYGEKAWVLDGAHADIVLVFADADGEPGLFVVDRADPAVSSEPISPLDLTRPMATLRFDGATARRVDTVRPVGELYSALITRACTALASEQAGAAQGCLAMTIEYATDRLQFGRPIGSFQAVRHRCADMFVSAESARVVARHAAAEVATDGMDAQAAAGIAKAYCSEAFLSVAESAIQVHGGVGFTWEHPAHLYFKRAKASALLFGDPDEQRDRIAAELLNPPGLEAAGPQGIPVEDELPAAALDSDAERVDQLVATLLTDHRPGVRPDETFWARQFDLGLAWVHHPEGEGGLAIDERYQVRVDRALAAGGVPDCSWRSGIGIHLVAPTLAAFGTPEQRQRHLRPIFLGQESWCQLFSEPGAGSDIAGLATRAVPSSDGSWLVNGQKVWTSLAHRARWGILCARTDPTVPKHAGLTYYIVDMLAEGVEVRPLRQLTGEAEFSEVYLTDVVVPDDDRVGPVGEGWPVTLTTLASERLAFSQYFPERGGGLIGRLLTLWRDHGEQRAHLRPATLALAVQAEVIRLAAAEVRHAESDGHSSPIMSFLKVAESEFDQRVLDLAMTLMGPEGLTYGSYAMHVPDTIQALDSDDLRRTFLFARSLTIAGGTSEIQRTIIADRVLRLPREPQPDRDIPWRDIARN